MLKFLAYGWIIGNGLSVLLDIQVSIFSAVLLIAFGIYLVVVDMKEMK
jgi:hypothetical protein